MTEQLALSKWAYDQVSRNSFNAITWLTKDGETYVAWYNGLSYWARVEDGHGNEVEMLSLFSLEQFSESEEEPRFAERYFTLFGYEVKEY